MLHDEVPGLRPSHSYLSPLRPYYNRIITASGVCYVLVNNRAEGNAPLTIHAIVDAIRNSQ